MLKIQRTTNGEIVFILSGRLDGAGLDELTGLIAGESSARPMVLELKDLVLIDRDAIGFLRGCMNRGIELRNCPSYIQTWMASASDEYL